MWGYVHIFWDMKKPEESARSSEAEDMNHLIQVLGTKLRPLQEQSILLNVYTFVHVQPEKKKEANWLLFTLPQAFLSQIFF